MLNEILIRRRNKIRFNYMPENDHPSNLRSAATITKNLETKFGYTLSDDLFKTLGLYTDETLTMIYEDLIKSLESLVPTHIYTPFYVNFPEQVIEMDEVEMYTNSIIHYTGDLIGKRIMPNYPKKDRLPFFESVNYKVLSLASMDDIFNIINNLLTSSTSISKQDKEDLSYFIRSDFFVDFIDQEVSSKVFFNHKEVMTFTLAELYKFFEDTEWIKFFELPKTGTDVLRFAVALCDGDISLKEKTKFKGLKRRDRRFILFLLDELLPSFSVLEDLKRHRNHWIRLAEKLHAAEYISKYIDAYDCIQTLRNHKISTSNTVIEEGIKTGKIKSILPVLHKRPGDFARRICKLLRMEKDITNAVVLNEFCSIIHKVSTPVLLQLRTLLMEENKLYRSFLIKGDTAKVFVKGNDLKEIHKSIRTSLISSIDTALMNRFSVMDDLGNIYLDEELKNYTLPMSQRSASASVETISRYSRIPIEKDCLRFFVYWKDMINQRVDLDLSVSFFNEKWECVGYVSYVNLKDHALKCYHSGDITSAPEGASEFIDIDLKHLKSKGISYVVPSVFNFTRQPFENIPLASFGWMERENLKKGEIYEPLSVKNKFNLTAKSQTSIPMVIDIVNNQIIWADLDISNKLGTNNLMPKRIYNRAKMYNINVQGNNVECNLNAITCMLINVVTSVKPDVYTLLKLHTIARGTEVDNEEDADIIFSVKNRTHCQLDKLMGEYMV